AMLGRLCGAEGMPAVVAGEGPADAVLLADEGGVGLESVLAAGALEPAELVAVAVGLARAVAAMHRRGVMHRGITPANVLLSGAAVRREPGRAARPVRHHPAVAGEGARPAVPECRGPRPRPGPAA